MKKILATVIFTKKEVTAYWELRESNRGPSVVIVSDHKGNPFLIDAEQHLIKETKDSGNTEWVYLGALDSAKGHLIKNE